MIEALESMYVVGKQLSGTRFTIPTEEEMAPVADELEQMVAELQESTDDEDLDDIDPNEEV